MKNKILQILGIIRIETRVLSICSPFRLCPGERDLSIKSTPHGEDNKFSLTRGMMSITPGKCCKYFLGWCHAKCTIETSVLLPKEHQQLLDIFLISIESWFYQRIRTKLLEDIIFWQQISIFCFFSILKSLIILDQELKTTFRRCISLNPSQSCQN